MGLRCLALVRGTGWCVRKQVWRGQQPCLRLRRSPASSSTAGSAEGAREGSGSLVPAAQEVSPEVEAALQRVKEAMAEAESTLEKLHELPSAREPSQLALLLQASKPALQVLALLGSCFATHSFGWVGRAAGGLLAALAMALAGYRKGSLSPSGALGALLVGWATLGSSFRAGITLLTFFFTSSALTQLGDEQKDVDEEHKKGGQRDWKQVACNALVPTVLAVAAAYLSAGRDALLQSSLAPMPTRLAGAFLGYYACCCGDTWASELGQLSTEEPRLITTLRPVRKGTNGGVTLVGLAASLAGGLCMGLTFYLASIVSPSGAGRAALQQWRLIPLGIAAGLVGSLIDSLLGATIQFTGYNLATGKITGRPGPNVAPISGLAILDNNMVNMVSASGTAALTALAAGVLFP